MSDARPTSSFPKQAVVVIHGMGEQAPMDTIRGFVRAVWETDAPLTQGNGMPDPSEVWSKPDDRTGSLELRRITTRQSRPSRAFPEGARTDFFELYWADLSGGSTLQQVEDWIFGLLLRNPFTRVPPRVLLAWLLLWLVTVVVVVLAIAAVMPRDVFLWKWPPFALLRPYSKWWLGIVSAALALGANRFLVPYFGRVVRYVTAKPENVAARQAIRQRGLELLTKLHDPDDEAYDRIIIVGHSLGSILAYDLVSYFWASRLASHTVQEGTPEFERLRALESAAAAASASEDAAAAYQAAALAMGRELRNRPRPPAPTADVRWIITDLVTVGSPLTHAEFLLASDVANLRERIETREYPSNPPVREVLDPLMLAAAKRAGFDTSGADPSLMCFNFGDKWQLHHAAPFSVVRWTNIYDPAHLVFFGDIISGPLAPAFGPAIVDVNLQKLRGRWSLAFTHTAYWSRPDDPSRASRVRIEALRKALDLAGDHI